MNIQDVEDKLDALPELDQDKIKSSLFEIQEEFKKKCSVSGLAERAKLPVDIFCALPHFTDLVRIMAAEITDEFFFKFKRVLNPYLSKEEVDFFAQEVAAEHNIDL